MSQMATWNYRKFILNLSKNIYIFTIEIKLKNNSFSYNHVYVIYVYVIYIYIITLKYLNHKWMKEKNIILLRYVILHVTIVGLMKGKEPEIR